MSIGRKFVTFAALVGVTVIGGGFATAAETGTQTVTYSINTTREITVTSETIAFGANSATQSEEIAAAGPEAVIAWGTNSASDKITVVVTALTSGVNLDVKGGAIDAADPDCTGTNEGTLAAGADTYVTDIETERDFIQLIVDCPGTSTKADVDTLTYRLVSSAAQGVSAQSDTVTYTIKAT